MKSFKPKNYQRGPEYIIQKAICDMLRAKGWYVKETHGNMYQSGFPDLFATHTRYGTRWIEVKNPNSYKFTPAQLEDFPKFIANGCGIWLLVAATEEEYNKLFQRSNLWGYLGVWKNG